MGFSYLNNKKWSQITREERLFCFELFEAVRNDAKPFLNLIAKNYLKEFEIGVEVCLYRDVMHAYEIGKISSNLPIKRTFDLVIFSEKEIIIIEAKSNQGFDSKQLDYFENDIKNHLPKLFKITNYNRELNFSLIAIHSDFYSPTEKTKQNFDLLLTWNQLAELYPGKKQIFNRASSIYTKNSSPQ